MKLLFSILLFSSIKLSAQNAVITGKISDENTNQVLAGATITISSLKKTTTSQSDGTYTFQNMIPGKYTLLISYVGYDSKNVSDAEAEKGQVTTLNITLVSAKNSNLTAVVVTATSAKKENINALLVTRRNASVVSDGISADMIRKSPDKNTGDVLKRISGTSVQDGKYVVVRGMNDRYNEAMLNGIILPSSESDRKTFAFDIFPSEIVDNITIYKSAEPDLPGSFAGGLVQVNTKDVPDKRFLSLKTSLGFNSITVNKDFYTYPGSKTDWLGYDNTVRTLPDIVANIPTQDFNSIKDNDPARKQLIDRSFGNNWGIYPKSSKPLNNSFQLSGGFNANLSKKNNYPRLGGIFGLTYNTSNTYAQQNRAYITQPLVSDYADFNFKDSLYIQNVLTSALGNLAFRINANNKIFFNNLLSINSTDQLITRGGYNVAVGQNDIHAYSYYFVSNRIYNTQIGGEHLLPKSKLKINWFGYYTDLKRDEPDNRFLLYFRDDTLQPYIVNLAYGGTLATVNSGLHFYGGIKDESKGANLDLSLPFDLLSNKQMFKFGGSYYYNIRSAGVRYFNTNYPDNFDANLIFQPINSIFDTSNFRPDGTGFFLAEPAFNFLGYNGNITNNSFYAMLDNRFTKKLRLVWGMRLEKYKNEVFGLDAAYKEVQVTDIKKDDWLPSANFVYSVLPKTNLRASYGRTVTRPIYRELSPNIFYDFVLNATYNGNPGLVPTYTDNYEVRWEHFFANAQYYSVSVFYKKLKDAIEPIVLNSGADSYTISYANFAKTKNEGIELELRKDFGFINKSLQNLVFYANTSFIKSKVDTVGIFESKKSTRPLFGQSPYIVNLSLQYTEPKTNIGLSVLYNKTGPRIWLLDQYYSRIVFEEPRPILDMKLSKTFLKKGIVEFSWADILHKSSKFFNDVDGNGKYDKGTDRITIERKFGYTMSLAVGYRF
ncbi:MAG: TonB-dependent receptor [Panacibacter sp.]